MKIFKRSKEKKDATIAAGIKSLTDKLKLKDKIAKANQWADRHKKKCPSSPSARSCSHWLSAAG